MNTIKLNTIGEAPIKKGGASGGGVYKEAWDEYRNSAICKDYALVKTFYNNQLVIVQPAYIVNDSYARNNPVAIYYDDAQFISNPQTGNLMSYSEYFQADSEYPTGGRNMTKEEFYDMNVVVLDRHQYKFNEGMTWVEWCDSAYNTGGFTIMDGLLKVPWAGSYHSFRMWDGDKGELVYGDDIIRPATNYVNSIIN